MKITMDALDYFAEHKRLITMLINSKNKELIKEGKRQIKEVKQQKEKQNKLKKDKKNVSNK